MLASGLATTTTAAMGAPESEGDRGRRSRACKDDTPTDAPIITPTDESEDVEMAGEAGVSIFPFPLSVLSGMKAAPTT